MSTVGPSTIVDLYLKDLFRPEAPPTPEEVSNKISEFLGSSSFFRHLIPLQRAIVDEIQKRITVRIGAATALDNGENHEEWLSGNDRAAWRLWPRLQRYLTHEKRFPVSVLAELDRSSDATLERLESPNRKDRWDRRGLVVGHVQSGKTTHYTTLAAKALDAGYRIVIILAGIHNNLRAQTQSRIDEYLVGRDSRAIRQAIRTAQLENQGRIGAAEADWRRGETFDDFQVITNTTAEDHGDFRAVEQQMWFEVNAGARLVMVVKKNTSVLRGMTSWLNSLMASGPGDQARIPHPTLIIDDEADHASVNTADPEADPSKINGYIRQLLLYFQRVSFVGYTATPFANIFADPDSDHTHKFGPDLFPRSFIINLKAPSNYVGPDKVFGHPGDDDAGIPPSPALPMHVPVTDSQAWIPDKHKKDHDPGPFPSSLREAVRLFLLATATRVARGHIGFHSSMLVHGTRFKLVQNRVRGQLERELSDIASLLTHGSEGTRQALHAELRGLWDREIVEKHEAFRSALPEDVGVMPEWNAVAGALECNASRFKVMAINGDSSDALAYTTAKDGLWVIAVGGDKLSRGLTLEGLVTSYFLRTSSMFDTLMQMGRWFGYRPGYADLCRVYTTPWLQGAFREITLAFEELRESFDEMARAQRKPIDFGLKVREPSEKLLITAGNKIRRGESVNVRFAGELVQSLDVPRAGAGADRNRRALTHLVTSMSGQPADKIRDRDTEWHVWQNQSPDKVLTFLQAYVASHEPCLRDGAARLREYIQHRITEGELKEWCVCLVSVARTAQRVQVAGLDIGLSRRSAQDEDLETYRMDQLAGRIEEAVDLSHDEFKQAQAESGVAENGVPSRESIRNVRPPTRGLLLLYPLTRTKDGEPRANPVDEYALGICVGFPSRLKGKSLKYTVNTVWRREQDPTGDWDEDGRPA
jgi:hypothetical protein